MDWNEVVQAWLIAAGVGVAGRWMLARRTRQNERREGRRQTIAALRSLAGDLPVLGGPVHEFTLDERWQRAAPYVPETHRGWITPGAGPALALAHVLREIAEVLETKWHLR